jgi:N-acetylmuramoyl-L-alanine amidase
MTRNSNRFVKLGVRTRYANRKHADAFVSIHANAVAGARKRTAEGIETYFLQVSRSARSKRVAARENSVVLQAKDRVSKNVLLNLMTGPKIVMSNKMAIDVQKGMLKNLRSKFRSVKDNGVRPAPFWVLVGAQMPAVLVETGYITHPKERKRLFSTTYQEGIAKGIAEGISNYFANREREME